MIIDVDCGYKMTTFTGRYINPFNFRKGDMCLEDIAHGLSLTCRFAGHCIRFYSVAQHAVHVAAQLNSNRLARVGLHHDDPEAYIGDMVRCVKAGLKDYRLLELDIWRECIETFNLDTQHILELPPPVKEADSRMLVTERRQLISDQSAVWDLEEKYLPYPFTIPVWSPEQAEEQFLAAHHQLFGDADLGGAD